MFHFADADQTDVAVLRRQGGLAIEYTKADFAVTGDIPLLYAAVLKKGRASAIVLNNCIAQIGSSGLVNTVLQVVQKGLALVLFRVTPSSQPGCPFYFQYDYKPEDEVFAFSTLGLRQILEGPGRVDHNFLDNLPSVLLPAFDSVVTVSQASSSSSVTGERHVSAVLADGLADGAALKNLVFQDASRIDELFPAGTKQITQSALNKVMASIDASSPVKNFCFFQANVLESFIACNFGDYKQARPASSASKVKSISYLWGSSFGEEGNEIITNEMLLVSLVTLSESWDAIAMKTCPNGRGFFSEAFAGITDLFNPLRSNVLPFSPAFNAAWVQELVVKIVDVMRRPRLVVLTEGELSRELTTIFFTITRETIAANYRKWKELWPREDQLWLAELSKPKALVPVFGGLSLAPVSVSSSSNVAASGDGPPPLKKAKGRKTKNVSASLAIPAVAAPAVMGPIQSAGGGGVGGGSGRSTRARSSGQPGTSPGKLCQYHVRHLFCNLTTCQIVGCKFIHQASVRTYCKNDMLAWADIALTGATDFDAVVKAIKAKA